MRGTDKNKTKIYKMQVILKLEELTCKTSIERPLE